MALSSSRRNGHNGIIPMHSVLATLALAITLPLAAQTYTPKSIRLSGVPDNQVQQLLSVAALKPGDTLTKEQIEAALQKLSDTGLFSDIGYTVDSSALVITLTPSSSSQVLPVRFGNIVWWQPAELEKLLEARIPLYHGELPLNGTLTDQVTDAIVALLEAKGVHAKVVAMPGLKDNVVDLNVTQPSVVLGDIQIVGATPEAEKQILKLQGYLGGQDFDRVESPGAIDHGVEQFFHNAGFLDTVAEPPSFGPPHKDPTIAQPRILIDTQVAVRDAALYRLSQVTVQGAPPVSQEELARLLTVHPNDPATLYDRNVNSVVLAGAYQKHGYLDADAKLDSPRDPGHHTIAYHFTVDPGVQYRLGQIDTTALNPQDRAAFVAVWHIPPGELLDVDIEEALSKAIAGVHSSARIQQRLIPNRRSKIADFMLFYAPSASPHP